MADDIKVAASVGVSDPAVATDEIASKHYQKIKAGWGPDGTWNETDDTAAARLPVGGGAIGAVNETPPVADTGTSSGLNGRLQRIAQRITTQTNTLLTESYFQSNNGQTTDLAAASDTANATIHGRLQRIAQRLSTLIGIAGTLASEATLETIQTGTGLDTDAAVAAGAAGSINAKLRRATQGLEDLKTAIVLAAGSNTIGRVLRAETTATCTVANGANVGSTVDCRGYTPVSIIVPTTFDGTQIIFNVSVDGSTWYALYDLSNTLVTMTVTAERAYPLWGELAGWNYIRVYTSTVQATTDTVFVIQLKS